VIRAVNVAPGVPMNRRLHFDSHVQFILRQCTQRIYLMKLLRKQGLPLKQLSILFQALVISRIQYAVSAWVGFILAVWKRKIDVFLLRAYHFGFCGDVSFDSLLFSADQTLFKSLRNIDHCIHPMPLDIKAYHYNLRYRGHDLVLSMYRISLFKKSYLIRHVFETV
jgi:hypothetical protein